MERWRRRRGKRRDWGEVSISEEGGYSWGSVCCSRWSRDAGTVGSGPRKAPPQRGFQCRRGMHSSATRSPRNKRGPSGLGCTWSLGKSLGRERRAWDGLRSPGSVSAQLVLESRVFPAAERGESILRPGCARTQGRLDGPGKRPRPWRGGSVRWVSSVPLRTGTGFKAHLKCPAFLPRLLLDCWWEGKG